MKREDILVQLAPSVGEIATKVVDMVSIEGSAGAALGLLGRELDDRDNLGSFLSSQGVEGQVSQEAMIDRIKQFNAAVRPWAIAVDSFLDSTIGSRYELVIGLRAAIRLVIGFHAIGFPSEFFDAIPGASDDPCVAFCIENAIPFFLAMADIIEAVEAGKGAPVAPSEEADLLELAKLFRPE